MLGLGLAPVPKRCAGFEAEAAVAGAIDNHRRADAEGLLGGGALGTHRANLIALDLGGDDGGVEQQGQVRLAPAFVVEQQVHQRRRALGIVHGEVEADLLDEAALAQFIDEFRATVQAGGADDVHAHLAGGVAAEHGTILAEDDAGAKAGGGERAADTGDAATGDEQVALERLLRRAGHGQGMSEASQGQSGVRARFSIQPRRFSGREGTSA